MRSLSVLLLLTMLATTAAADPPGRRRGEFLQMWDAIVSGGPIGPGTGWFKPGQSRYTWDRLKARADRNGDGRITPAEFNGSPALFAALDRDGDGAITADDLDWSDNSSYLRQLNVAQQFLRRADQDGNKKLSREEWALLFDEIAKGKSDLKADDLRKFLFPPPPPRPTGGGLPSRDVLLLSLLTGELGSGAEGPKLDAPAPDFTLPTADGKSKVTLGDYRGKKPVVLIFGSFT